ncbi:MAG: FAD-dependent oxidoreductase [Clostridiales bacterium]|jgi:NADH dehydrogenase|nr:FAD-dependent oxidoreductase [Clostridiales bacterium]
MPAKQVIILGAGYGGIEAAKTLHRLLRKRNDVEITLVDQNHYHTLLTELHQVAGHRIGPNGVKVAIEHVLQYTNVRFVHDRINRVDLEKRKLFSADREYSFDYLILAAGSEPACFGIPGMKEHAFTLWSLEDAQKIHDHILRMFQLAANEKDPRKRSEMLTFVVGGGGFTGVEMVGELMEWTAALSRQFKIPKEEIRLAVIEALPTLCPILDHKLSDKIEAFLKKHGVEVYTNTPITQVFPDSISIESGDSIPTQTLIWTGGVQAKELVKQFGITLGKRNRIVVNKYLQTAEHPNVYAIGDIMEFTENGEVLPALVESALQSGNCAAKNIAAEISGGKMSEFKPKLHGVMISVGSFFSVAQIKGLPRLTGIPATIMKHLVNMHYLFGIGGLELIWDYICHQFLYKDRTYNGFIETVIGHIKRRNFTFWLVPLRIWLGIMWLASGLQKIQDGWFGDWKMFGPGGAVDATSSASLISLVGENTPKWYAWIVENIIYPNSLLFQKLITITEIGLGLAFIFGIFTFIAALVSIGMNINFMLSTGLPATNTGLPDLWYIAASIAMLAGAGRTLGVDYYLIPFLRNQLRYFQKNRSFHLFRGWQW